MSQETGLRLATFAHKSGMVMLLVRDKHLEHFYSHHRILELWNGSARCLDRTTISTCVCACLCICACVFGTGVELSFLSGPFLQTPCVLKSQVETIAHCRRHYVSEALALYFICGPKPLFRARRR